MTYQEWYQADRQNRLQIAARKVRAARNARVMTRKDYITLARALREVGASAIVCHRIADVLLDHNANFDCTQFIATCGW